MATPKLKLHSLSDERPSPYPTRTLLTFRRIGDKHAVGSYSSDSHYIQKEACNDNERFYVSTDDVAAFLTEHNLVELPAPKEQRAYTDAYKAWIASPESYISVNTPYYLSSRKAFIKSHIEQSTGRSFSNDLYTTYCCCW